MEENKILTPSGKEIRIKQGPNYFTIVFYPGGELPAMLKGEFTLKEYAENAIRSYLSAKSEG